MKTDLELEKQIGARLRLARKQKGISQRELGSALGVTFQQVQKYELGSNRLSLSKSIAAARALDVDPSYFFEGLSPKSNPAPSDSRLSADALSALTNESGAKLVSSFLKINDPATRQKIVELVQTISKDGKSA